jgi:eukaryotic-like serine/threonine-protein kinase
MNLTEGGIAWTTGPRAYPLGELVDKGRAGNIYSLPEPRAQLAKIYADGVDLARYERKIEAMLDAPPDLPDIVEGDERHVQIVWPEAALRDEKGRFLGFLMPAVDLAATHELEWILQERQARATGLVLGLAAKIGLAANIAAAIAELHMHGHRVVDFNPGKLRFNARSRNIAILDCDSFSIRGKNEHFAADYAAGQLTADYLAPEFHDQPIEPKGEELQDRFALAVLIFQLLNFGIHPFTGIPQDEHCSTDIPGRIAQGCYAYGVVANPLLNPSPVSGHLAMPGELRSLFDRAFVGDGSHRPCASDWADLLRTYVQPWNKRLQACAANAGHQHFADLHCADCARAELIVSVANASDMSLVYVRDPMAPGVHPFGAPQSVGDSEIPSSDSWQTLMPMEMPLPDEEPSKGLPKGAVVALKAAAALVIVAIALKLGIGYGERLPSHPQSARIAMDESEDASVAPSPGPDLMGFPSMEKEEALTEGYAWTAARAIAKGDRGAWANAMSALRGRIPTHDPFPPNGHQAEFAAFSSSISPESYNEKQRQSLITDLHQALRDNPYDDEAAVELGWLSLLGGERDEARKYYVHAIWVNPDRASAWYGYGVIAGNDLAATGALAAAELLTTDPTQVQPMRAAFPPLMLRLCGVKPESFARLESKAQRIAELNRPVAPAPEAAPAANGVASPKSAKASQPPAERVGWVAKRGDSHR